MSEAFEQEKLNSQNWQTQIQQRNQQEILENVKMTLKQTMNVQYYLSR